MQNEPEITQAIRTIQTGGLLVYPTEAVFGIGCDFKNQSAVERLLSVKERDISKGLILIASHVQQILPLIKVNNQSHLARALKTWPGHHTWVFERSHLVPKWVSGSHNSVAVRVSAHPTVGSICDILGQAIVSTSANKSGETSCQTLNQVKNQFGLNVDYYLNSPLGQSTQASTIRLASTGEYLR